MNIDKNKFLVPCGTHQTYCTKDDTTLWEEKSSKNAMFHAGHLLILLENVSQSALSAVLTVLVSSHEDTSTTVWVGALHTSAGDHTTIVHLVELQHGQRHLLLLMLDLLWLGVVLLLLLLTTTTTQPQHQVQSALLLNVVVSQSATILELLAGKDQTLLVGWDSLLVLNLRLHILDGIIALDLEGDSLPCQSFNKNLHLSILATP
mmetsp:Transcript_27776/g.47034  ORF Transcript_27776/g.47034 Transcript_27776/m.47034 type:complete len:205 (+) Transcript_27776:165-779(+)